MSLSGYNPYDRYRNRSLQRVSSGLVLVAVIFASMAIGFWLGRQRSAETMLSMREEVESLRQQHTDLQNDLTALRAGAKTAELRYQQLQQQYTQDLPPKHKELIDLLKDQLSKGMDPDRLASAIRSARPPGNCTEPETRRFVVSTPAYKGVESNIAITEGNIVITGDGISARNDKGEPEAWYDPAQPVEIKFAVGGVLADTKKGPLPIQHSVVSGDREYRFNLSEGARSFIKVTFDSCDYP